MTESEREHKARDFVDSILEVNRRHGVDQSSAEIGYDAAVQQAVATFRCLPDDTFRHQPDEGCRTDRA